MAKYKLQEMPDMHSDGKKRVYPKIIARHMLTTKEVVRGMHSYDRTLAPSVIEAVLTDAADYLARMLSMGHSVRLDGIGTLSLSLDFDDDKPSEMKGDDDRMLYRKVTVKDVNYKASPELIKRLRMETELERDMGGVTRLRRKVFTQEERIANALRVIDERGFITLSAYASINHMSRTTASEELKRLCANPDGPINWTGHRTHKVWIRRDREGTVQE